MDFVIAFLRLAHIVLGILWVGFGAVGAWIVYPAANKLGEKGDTLLRTFYGYTNFNKVFPIAAVGTTLAGIILWILRADGPMLTGFTNTGSIVMGIGAVFGLLAFGHGAAATGRLADAYAKAAIAYEESDNPTDEQKATLAEARKKNQTHTNISAILATIAVVAMASARYLP